MRKRLACLLLPLVLSACSGPGHFQPQPPIARDAATLYLYRPEASNPGRQPLRLSYPAVLVDGRPAGTLKFNSHKRLELPAGSHELRFTGLVEGANWEPRDVAQRIDLKPGEVRYVKLDVQFNLDQMTLGSPGPSYRIRIVPMRAEDAIYEIRATRAQ